MAITNPSLWLGSDRGDVSHEQLQLAHLLLFLFMNKLTFDLTETANVCHFRREYFQSYTQNRDTYRSALDDRAKPSPATVGPFGSHFRARMITVLQLGGGQKIV